VASPSLESLLTTLASSDVEFIVVGPLAAVAQGAPATTHDLDIVHRRTPDNVAKLVDVLVNTLDARYRGRDDILWPTPEMLSGPAHSLLKTSPEVRARRSRVWCYPGRMRGAVALVICILGCGGGSTASIDAAIDVADVAPDAPPADCAAAVSAGSLHTMVRRTDGKVFAWGSNPNGVLGDGTIQPRTGVVESVVIETVDTLSAGVYHNCAIVVGLARCWGRGMSGQLGDGTMTQQLMPVTVPGLSGLAGISTGTNSSCAYAAGGGLWCWGGNPGNNSSNAVPTPVQPTGMTSGLAGVVSNTGLSCAVVSAITTAATRVPSPMVSAKLDETPIHHNSRAVSADAPNHATAHGLAPAP
jgi:hypothetical protein